MNTVEEFALTTHMVTVDLAGMTYYAQESGLYVMDESEAFKGFTRSAAERIKAKLAVDPQIVCNIVEMED